MSKAFILGFVVGLALLIVVSVAGSRPQQKDADQERRQAELERYRTEIVDATPVQLGVLTDKQQIHSKLYTHYLERRGGRTISGLVNNTEGKKIVETIAFVPLMPVIKESETPENYFSKLTQISDAVIRGKVTKKISQISDNDAFIFTDYDIEIIEVLKKKDNFLIEAGTAITVTRPGGKVVLGGIIVKARDDSFTPLPMNNEVVLFLKFIPESGAYKTADATGSFELDGSSLHPLTKLDFPLGVLRNSPSFLQTLRLVSKE